MGKRRRADGADGPRHAQGVRWPRELIRHERSFASSAAHAAAVVAKEKAGAVKADAETPARVPQHIDAETWALVCTRLVAGMQKVLRKETWGMLALLRNSGHEVYLVGGTVRDMVLGRLPKDVDVLTTATLDEVQRLLRRNTDRSFVPLIIGKRHPIVQVFRKEVVMNEDGKTTGRIQRKHLLDISSFFTDAAAGEVPEHGSTEPAPPKAERELEPTARMGLVEPCDEATVHGYPVGPRSAWADKFPAPDATKAEQWARARRENARRRDFTSNGLLFDPFNNVLYDDVGGLRDLLVHKELHPILSCACTTLAEDPARVFRALRFASRTGLSMSDSLSMALSKPKVLHLVRRMNSGRVQHELHTMLSRGHAERAVDLLVQYKIIDEATIMELVESIEYCDARAISWKNLRKTNGPARDPKAEQPPESKLDGDRAAGNDMGSIDIWNASNENLLEMLHTISEETKTLEDDLKSLHAGDRHMLKALLPSNTPEELETSFARRALRALDARCSLEEPCDPVEWLVALVAPVLLYRLHKVKNVFPFAAHGALSRRAIVDVRQGSDEATESWRHAEREYQNGIHNLSQFVDTQHIDEMLTSAKGRKKLRAAHRGSPAAFKHISAQLYNSALKHTFDRLETSRNQAEGTHVLSRNHLRIAQTIFASYASTFSDPNAFDKQGSLPDEKCMARHMRHATNKTSAAVSDNHAEAARRSVDMLARACFPHELARLTRIIRQHLIGARKVETLERFARRAILRSRLPSKGKQ